MSRQLELFSVPEHKYQEMSGTEFVPDAKMAAIQRFCSRASITPYIEKYTPSRRNKKYFRLSWREGKKWKHLHIPGGNTDSPLARYRAEKLQQLCDRGAELEEVIAAVKTYSNR